MGILIGIMKDIKITELRCRKCGHYWYPRTDEVRQCPKCKSAWWDKNGKEARPK